MTQIQDQLFPIHEDFGVTKDDRFTPPIILEPARRTFGGHIELDPFSCEAANVVVKADRYFTIVDDGLNQEWKARSIFCNPPYSKIFNCTNHAISQFICGSGENIIFVCNASTDTAYAQLLLQYTNCFPSGRIEFWHPTIELDSPRYPTLITLISRNFYVIDKFCYEFAPLGVVKR